MEEVKESEADILITNYERVRDGDIQPSYFTAASLDEASVLRSFGSKTYQTFLDKFKGVPYKLVATQPLQGVNPLCRIPGGDGHGPGPYTIFSEGQLQSRQPDPVPQHGG